MNHFYNSALWVSFFVTPTYELMCRPLEKSNWSSTVDICMIAKLKFHFCNGNVIEWVFSAKTEPYQFCSTSTPSMEYSETLGMHGVEIKSYTQSECNYNMIWKFPIAKNKMASVVKTENRKYQNFCWIETKKKVENIFPRVPFAKFVPAKYFCNRFRLR